MREEPDSIVSRAKRFPLYCLICAGVFTALDLPPALWVFRVKWMPMPGLLKYSALSMGIYAAFAVTGGAIGWLVWLCARITRLDRPSWARALTGPVPPFAVVGTLWAMALGDVAVVQDILRLRVWTLGIRFLGCGAIAAGLASLGQAVCRQYPVSRRVLRILGCGCGGVAALGLAAWCASGVWARTTSDASQPNVLLITVDALRQDYLSCYGGPVGTPHIDQLAKDGLRFSHAEAAAPWTRPSCAALHLAVYPMTHGVGEKGVTTVGKEANTLPAAVMTLAEAFQAQGYTTQAFVSNTQIDRRFGFDRGFGEYCMYEDIGRRTPWLDLSEAASPGRRIARNALRLARLEFLSRSPRLDEDIRGFVGGLLAPSGAFSTGSAMRWIRRARRPFFLWVHYMDVHQYHNFGFSPPQNGVREAGFPGLMKLTSATSIAGPLEIPPWDWKPKGTEVEEQPSNDRVEPILAPDAPDSDLSLEDYTRRYRNNLTYLDGLVGGLLSELDAAGLTDTTHVVLTSDHGEEFGDHGRMWHGETQYEELTKVPLIVRGPAAQQRGTTLAQMCSLVDLAPTLLDLAGLSQPGTFMGSSLLPLIRGEDRIAEIVYSEFTDAPDAERKAIRWQMMKYIEPNKQHQAELYDLVADPREQTNLLETAPQRAAELMAQLRTWRQKQAVAAARIRKGRQGRAVIDAEMTEALRATGYVE